MPLAFRPATTGDVETIRALADRIWHACYPGIIPVEQIRYMLGWMYAPHKLAEELRHGVHYELALLDEVAVGYLGYELQVGGTVLHLNKLYLAPELHGQGLGQAMLDRVLAAARAASAVTVELRVNKANTRALRAYERAGFVITGSQCQDIGGGYAMDDYVMRRSAAAD
jgi:ribosomal protein S18 acetylase RimI-like enzyme